MPFGFHPPARRHTATLEALASFVTRGEALGFHAVMTADRIVFPTDRGRPCRRLNGAFSIAC